MCSSWGKKVGEEGLGDRLPSFLRLRIRPVGRLIRDAESVSFLEKWTFGERKRKLSGSKNNLEIVKRSKVQIGLIYDLIYNYGIIDRAVFCSLVERYILLIFAS